MNLSCLLSLPPGPGHHGRQGRPQQEDQDPGPPHVGPVGRGYALHHHERPELLVGPHPQQDQQIGRGDVLDDGLVDRRDLHPGPLVHLLPALLDAEHPGEQDDLDGGEHHQEESAAPEVQLVHKAVAQKEDGRLAGQKGRRPQGQGGLAAGEIELVLQKGHRRLDQGHRGGDAGDQQQQEPQPGEQRAQRQLLEDQGHGDEAQVEGPALGHLQRPAPAEEDEGRRDDDGGPQDHLAELVGGRGRQAGQGHVVVLPQVAGVGQNDADAHRQGEEYLPGRLQPHPGVGQLGEIGIPDEAQGVPHRQFRQGRIRRAQGQHPDRQQDPDAQQHRHSVPGELFDPALQPLIDEEEVQQKGDDEEGVGRTPSGKKLIVGQSLVAGKKGLHGGLVGRP